ncbi:bacteriohemerythrin [Rhodoferax sp.]|uniref:bacteriohemerythrin n=1 Tax=Rhodoferax sp. TaxID=50421 RepID=UPI0026166A86|nr:bacteriohemerythrin [Rhodoferax sp.]MDD5478326.1 bacteriohemerythrin [Rhodoferax sp.]
MKLMAWTPNFETGLELVDAQHHGLVDMVNQAAPHLALNDELAKRSVGPLLDNLTRYAAVHFRDEERLMAHHHLARDYLVHHHQSHQNFVDELTQMRQQYEQEGTLSGQELLRFLSSWLTFHILEEDQRIPRQMAAMATGMTAEQAYEQVNQPQDNAQAVYHQSLLELFTLLSERNQKLVQANAAVHKSQAELQAVNASLEQRVQERTAELQASVAQLKLTQSQLLQAEKMAAVGQLAAGVAHEINNPVGFVTSNLGTLSGYIEQLFGLIQTLQTAAAALPPEQVHAVQAACEKIDLNYLREDIPSLLTETQEGLARVKRIVSDLRDFSHSDEGQWAPVDLNHVLESALNVANNEIKYKAKVVKALQPLPPVTCIAAQINQVLVNMLVNAAQSIETQGVITVRTGAQPDSVWLEISDTGCGMTEDVKKRIFEPFYTTKPVGKGTGLGLSITWEIINRHHGQLSVNSTPDQGTTFRITLPIKAVST